MRPERQLDLTLIHEAVTHQAGVRPDALAVRHGDRRIGYAELDAAADRYAGLLAARGLGPGQFVPVLLPKSPQLVAVLLAVLKTGAAYAALDRRWPRQRIDTVVSALRAPLVVTGEPIGAAGWTPPEFGSGADGFTPVRMRNDQPASVFFTSGSSGVPKGVISPHRGTTRLFGADYGDFGPGRVMVQSAPLPWDGFTLETWGMLTTGGTSVITDGEYLMPQDLRRLITHSGLDTVFLTTSLFNLFVAEDCDSFTGLRQVFTGGERAATEAFASFVKRHPDIALIHCYGPAEATVFTTAHRVSAADCERERGIPLGTPVPETGVRLIDGEICVWGTGLSLGYLDDPALTAQKFVTVEIEGTPTRLYRTGDTGEIDDAGVLYFTGRKDRQVKIAGHRIEPGEIEAVAAQLAGISRCAVIPVPDDTGRPTRLALFYLPSGQADSRALRRELAERLPRYLIPDLLMPVSALPLNPNGKLDSTALLEAIPAGSHT